MEQTKLIVNKAFFGKENCLKIALNSQKECYMHWGMKKDEKYEWFKIKFNDMELGQIYDVLDGKKSQVAFFHSFNGKQRQIWINKSADGESVFFKIKEMNKSLGRGESVVMRILIASIIARMNIEQ